MVTDLSLLILGYVTPKCCLHNNGWEISNFSQEPDLLSRNALHTQRSVLLSFSFTLIHKKWKKLQKARHFTKENRELRNTKQQVPQSMIDSAFARKMIQCQSSLSTSNSNNSQRTYLKIWNRLWCLNCQFLSFSKTINFFCLFNYFYFWQVPWQSNWNVTPVTQFRPFFCTWRTMTDRPTHTRPSLQLEYKLRRNHKSLKPFNFKEETEFGISTIYWITSLHESSKGRSLICWDFQEKIKI